MKCKKGRKHKYKTQLFLMILLLIAALAVLLSLLFLQETEDGENLKEEPPTGWGSSENASDPAEVESEDTQAEKPLDGAADEERPAEEEEIAPELQEAERILESMTLEEKIYQMFIVTQEQLTGVSTVTRSGETTKEAIQKYPVGGIVYFAKNLISREQCMEMIDNIQTYSKLGLFISVDEEGGTVARLGNNAAMGTTSFPPMGIIGESKDVQQAYDAGYTIGTEIAALGFNLDFAPVADVNSNPDNPVIGTRAFSSDPQIAAEMVSACVNGFQDSRILCTLKHFPGHGDTDADSHYGEARTDKTLEELEQCEWIPFRAGIQAGADFVMVGHICAPNVTDETLPASLSYDMVTGFLRGQLGFEGIVITDSLSMQAITDQYSSGEAAVKAVKAGVDILLMPENLADAAEGLVSAVQSGEISEEHIDESVLRILKIKSESGIL